MRLARLLLGARLLARALLLALTAVALVRVVAEALGLGALFAVRLVTLGVRFLGQRWALTGAPA